MSGYNTTTKGVIRLSYGLIWFPRANLEPAHLDLEPTLKPSSHFLVRGEDKQIIHEGFRASLNLNLCKNLELQLFAGWAQN